MLRTAHKVQAPAREHWRQLLACARGRPRRSAEGTSRPCTKGRIPRSRVCCPAPGAALRCPAPGVALHMRRGSGPGGAGPIQACARGARDLLGRLHHHLRTMRRRLGQACGGMSAASPSRLGLLAATLGVQTVFGPSFFSEFPHDPVGVVAKDLSWPLGTRVPDDNRSNRQLTERQRVSKPWFYRVLKSMQYPHLLDLRQGRASKTALFLAVPSPCSEPEVES